MTASFRFDGLDGKVAVVTGASQNLGAAMATALAAQGSSVAVIGRTNRTGAERVAAAIQAAGGHARAWLCDLTQYDDVQGLFEEIAGTLGTVDVLVNNAGGWSQPTPFWEVDLSDFRRILTDNLDSTFMCSQAVAPAMMERGWGRIICVSSQAGRVAKARGHVGYGAAKGGVIALARQMAAELGPYGITVNTIAPGTTAKEVGRKHEDAYYHSLADSVVLRRIGVPDDHAAAVCFLASPSAGWISGAVLDVHGGGTVH